MANVGSILITPESGMIRLDDTNRNIKYNGTFTTNTDSNKHNNTCTYSTIVGDSIEFYFYGSRFYIIDMFYKSRSNRIEVMIDDSIDSYLNCYSATLENQKVLVYKKEGLEKGLHHVKLTNQSTMSNTTMVLDAIDINEDGFLITKEEYEEILQQSKKNYPVKFGGDSITSEENVANYASKLVYGERQLLVSDKLNGIYLTDGQGGYTKLNTDNGGDIDLPTDEEIDNMVNEVINNVFA